ncbi:MAG TPA: NAD-dependent epimerase/dehydratase family protein, partial [Acidimicrobiales bacterium]|nr:NAD-dependent epimerase/dehydratase family protein [Acidimicrobiales bacterium]
GFIGANLCRALRAEPWVEQVVVVDDFSSGRRENLADLSGVEVVEGSVLDSSLLETVVNGAEAVVHLAARPSVPRSLEDPLATHEVNATGTLRVLEAARTTSRAHVLVASSSSVYGDNRALPAREDTVALPVSPYAASKLAAEAYGLAYARSFALPVAVFRFFNVFGPLQRADHAYAAVVPAFVSAALAGEPLSVHGDGRQTRDFTFVDDVVKLLVAALLRGISTPTAVNLAFGGRSSILELIGRLEDVLGHPVSVRHGAPRRGDVRDSQADQSRLRALFPEATPVPLVDGLRATVAWYRSVSSGVGHGPEVPARRVG